MPFATKHCRPGLQHNKYYWCFVFIYNIYHTIIYFYIFFLFLNKLFQNYVLNFIYHTSSNIASRDSNTIKKNSTCVLNI